MDNKAYTFFRDALNGFLSLIYPNICVVCQNELPDQDNLICFFCSSDLHYTYFEKYNVSTMADELFWGRIKLDHVYALLYYEKGNSTQQILFKIKYQEGQQLGVYMGSQIANRLKGKEWLNGVDAILPIPLHSKKEFKRGYNQSLILAKGFAEENDIPIKMALYRKKHHASQTRKSREEREQNVKGIFGVNPQQLNGLNHVIIIDDVLTTGSTLEEAAQAVKQFNKNINISLVTLAIAK
jgi:ComF family protein